MHMAQTLLAVLLVLAAAHAAPDLARLRDFSWLKKWARHWSGRDGAPSPLWIVLVVFLACVLAVGLLQPVLFGFAALAFGACVLFYAWGPRDLDAGIEAVLKAPDSDRRDSAAQQLRPVPSREPLPFQSTPLVEATFESALSRWFGVLFWFVVLGPAGAIGYRVVQLLARHPSFADDLDGAARARLERAALVLDWAPSHLVALTLALVTEFDAVLATWRNYHAAHGQGYFTLDLGFLGALARAGVDSDVVAGDGYAVDVDDPLTELAQARTVLRRILHLWVALIALCVIAGWAA